ncbi:hypothetical protein NL50_03805 [Clostridium acetobutylicum]|nr:hypothetical protein NL50_03805 [Clostridium acetobutylicum]
MFLVYYLYNDFLRFILRSILTKNGSYNSKFYHNNTLFPIANIIVIHKKNSSFCKM